MENDSLADRRIILHKKVVIEKMNIHANNETARDQLNELYLKDSLLQSPLRIIKSDNAVILPDQNRQGGVIDDKGNFVVESAYRYADINLWGGSYDVEESAIESVSETVIFIGQIFKHWGNFLFDCLARLWYVLEEDAPYRLAYCSMQAEEGILGCRQYREFLELLGISQDQLIDIRKPTRFRTVIVPQLSIFPGTFYTKEFLTVFDKAVIKVNQRSNGVYCDKLYFTRTRMKNCKELGEKRIEEEFRKQGFAVIAPEELPIAEQIYLISHCKVLASIEGTTSHNILFAGERIEHIILRKQSYINTRQVLFDKLRKIEPQYIDIYYEPFRGFPLSHDAGPFWVGITAAMRAWMKECGVRMTLKDCISHFIYQTGNAVIYAMKCIYYKYVLKY